MKSAYIISNERSFFKKYVSHLKTLGFRYDESENGIRLYDDIKKFTFYDMVENEEFFDTDENPDGLKERGFVYAFLVECRYEDMFCDIVRQASSQFDIFIYDRDGELFTPDKLNPNNIAL